MRILTAIIFAGFMACTAPVYAQSARPIEKFQDWSAYVYDNDGKRLCFVSSEPKDMEPKNVIRGQVLFYVSTWAGTEIRNEISIKIGYPFKPDSAPVVQVGNDKFVMFAKDDKAFLASTEQENKLVEAMKKGNIMVVSGVSKRGTNTTDKYSLVGVSAALDRMAKDCP